MNNERQLPWQKLPKGEIKKFETLAHKLILWAEANGLCRQSVRGKYGGYFYKVVIERLPEDEGATNE